MNLRRKRQRLCSTKEHTLRTHSQWATHRTKARPVLTGALLLRPADTAVDPCTFLNLPQPLRPRAGWET